MSSSQPERPEALRAEQSDQLQTGAHAAAGSAGGAKKPLARRLALRIALLYVIFGLVWFGLGEVALARFSPAAGRVPLLLTINAWLFIAVTTVFLFLLIHHFVRSLQRTQELMNASFESIAQQYQRLFERNPSAIIIFDPETRRILAANDVSLLLYGYPRETFLSMTTLDLVVEDERPRARALDGTYQTHDVQNVGPFRVRRGDGRIISVEAVTHEVDFDGRPARIALVTDITERLRSERAIAEHRAQLERRVADRTMELSLANERLREQIATRIRIEEKLRAASQAAQSANEAKTAFLANTSHEIRTPLTSIIGYVDLLADPAIDPEERDKYLGIVSQNAQHLLALIDDLMDLSRAEAGIVSITLADHAPMEIARQAAILLEQRAAEKQIAIHLRFDGAIPETIRTDGVRLRQILLNLINNAIKFTDGGTVTLTVKQVDAVVPALEFHVADTGIGIESEQLQRIFEPFFQIEHKHTRRFGGFGLGLAISRQLARRLGGDISVTSAPGKGSSFVLTLPLTAPAGTPAPPPQKPAVAATMLDGHILFAEDNGSIRMLVEEYLRRAGARVTSVVNGEQAVAWMERACAGGSADAVDLVLLDRHMPVLDGDMARRQIRAAGFRGPIVGLTADFSEKAAAGWKREGWDAMAPKPIDRNSFIPLLARLLSEARSQRPEPTAR